MSLTFEGKSGRRRITFKEKEKPRSAREQMDEVPHWVRLRTALLRVLRAHPEARMAVVRAIEEHKDWLDVYGKPEDEGSSPRPPNDE